MKSIRKNNRNWCAEHSATEYDAVVKLKSICARPTLGKLFQISLKPVSLDKKTRNAYRKSQLPSFKYVKSTEMGILK